MMTPCRLRIGSAIWLLLFALAASSVAAQEELGPYPKPLVHTPANHPAQRVLLLDVPGLSAVLLSEYVTTNPTAALAELSRRGVTFTNVHVPWSDPAAGLMALVTGGTPVSTGIVSSLGFDRSLSPSGSHCELHGTSIALAGMLQADGQLDARRFPLDPAHNCQPVPPHALLRVNTLFEAVQIAGGQTAWAGANAAFTDLVRGPSGKGLTIDCSSLGSDEQRARAVMHWMDALDCEGRKLKSEQAPTLFGMTVNGLALAQAACGLDDPCVRKALVDVDTIIAQFLGELKARHIYDTTWVFVSASYGQTLYGPLDQKVAQASLASAAGVPLAAIATTGDMALVWLQNSSQTSTAGAAYRRSAGTLGIERIDVTANINLLLNTASTDPRMPDIMLEPRSGFVWLASGLSGRVGFGGLGEEDTHVAMLVSGAQLSGRLDKTPVPSTQMAPLLLRALGMEKFDLQALHQEHTPALPGIF